MVKLKQARDKSMYKKELDEMVKHKKKEGQVLKIGLTDNEYEINRNFITTMFNTKVNTNSSISGSQMGSVLHSNKNKDISHRTAGNAKSTAALSHFNAYL